MTIYFISGFGEDSSIFEHIKDQLQGTQCFISLWDLAGNQRNKNIDISIVASEVIKNFGIKKQDLIIGHSTGAWLALHIKNQLGCRIIQIAGWTDLKKVNTPITNRHVIYLAVWLGLIYNPVVAKFVQLRYADRPSKDIFKMGFLSLIKGPKANVLNQLGLIFNPYSLKITVEPDFAIHALADDIIKFPDAAFHHVEGDHFSLYTHPEQVGCAIVSFLRK